jgi:hypothetical protein
MAEDLDDATWELLDRARPIRPTQEEIGTEKNVARAGLAMLLKMTRLHDLGLAQLCIPELVTEEEAHPSETARSKENLREEVRHT